MAAYPLPAFIADVISPIHCNPSSWHLTLCVLLRACANIYRIATENVSNGRIYFLAACRPYLQFCEWRDVCTKVWWPCIGDVYSEWLARWRHKFGSGAHSQNNHAMKAPKLPQKRKCKINKPQLVTPKAQHRQCRHIHWIETRSKHQAKTLRRKVTCNAPNVTELVKLATRNRPIVCKNCRSCVAFWLRVPDGARVNASEPVSM